MEDEWSGGGVVIRKRCQSGGPLFLIGGLRNDIALKVDSISPNG